MVLYCIFIMKFAKDYIFDFLRVVWINDGSGENNEPQVVKKKQTGIQSTHYEAHVGSR